MRKNDPQREIEIPEKEIRCPLCGELLGEDKSFCHKCGKYLGKNGKRYQPISEKKAQKIKIAIGAVAIAVFLIIYILVILKK